MMNLVKTMLMTKKPACVFAFALLCSISAFAMDLQGSLLVNAGINLGALQPHFTGAAELDDTFHIGGRLQVDYMFGNHFGVGLESGFSGADVGNTDYSIGTIPILARIAWHPFSFAKIDPYLIAKLGYGFPFWTNEGNADWTEICGGFMWGVNVGARFFFTENIGIFVEAGYECLDIRWDHPNMELEKWNESASARTFAIIGITFKTGK